MKHTEKIQFKIELKEFETGMSLGFSFPNVWKKIIAEYVFNIYKSIPGNTFEEKVNAFSKFLGNVACMEYPDCYWVVLKFEESLVIYHQKYSVTGFVISSTDKGMKLTLIDYYETNYDNHHLKQIVDKSKYLYDFDTNNEIYNVYVDYEGDYEYKIVDHSLMGLPMFGQCKSICTMLSAMEELTYRMNEKMENITFYETNEFLTE